MHPRSLLPRALLLAGLVAAVSRLFAAAPADPLLGRWGLALPNGSAGWLELKAQEGWVDGSILWGGGSVLPLASVTLDGPAVTATRVREVERKDAAGRVVRRQQLTETVTARLEGGELRGTRVVPRPNGQGFDRTEFTGRRLTPLPPRPDLAAVRFGPPVALFNGRDLTGWVAQEPRLANAWGVVDGVLVNRPPAREPGKPGARTANLRTSAEFTDFRLTLEVSVPARSNSGVYLRGLYEVQVADSHGKALDSHNMGAIYSRLTPAVAAEKPAGEWQTLELTLVDQHATVVLNGRMIIDNQPLLGVTGGALGWDPLRPGPILLQGDHGPVSYRNLVLRPVAR